MEIAPSQINSINYSLILEWIFVIACILGLIKVAHIIGREKETYLESATTQIFHGLKLLIPSWWTKTLEKNNEWKFERTDTHYEWMSILLLKDLQLTNLEAESKHFFQEAGILFDLEETQINQIPANLIKSEMLLDNIQEFVRFEGMATEKIIERIYLDSCWIILKNNPQKVYHLMSYSSVLNGSLEGPYFEEMLKRAELS